MELLRRGAEHSIQDKVCVCDLPTGTTSTSEAVLEIRKTRQVSVALDNHNHVTIYFSNVSAN